MSPSKPNIRSIGRIATTLLAALAIPSCSYMTPIGGTPQLTPQNINPEYTAMMSPGLPYNIAPPSGRPNVQRASLWTGERGSLLGDNRAIRRGDIVTVVIRINDSASFANATDRSRQGNQNMDISALFGLPEDSLEAGTSLAPGVDLGSSGRFSGDGTVVRNERMTLRVAATVIEVLPNGVLSISGTQEVRVNNELRELLVTGFVRPADISRQNEVSYDKIAAARISYGGRGQLTDMQQPRWGQQALDHILPF